VYTFALYHDHESAAVSVCVDTEANSRRVVAHTNRYNMKHFTEVADSLCPPLSGDIVGQLSRRRWTPWRS